MLKKIYRRSENNGYFGKYKGYVEKVFPDGTINFICPIITNGEKFILGPANPYFPPSLFIPPNINDKVIIEFEDGNINFPIYSVAWNIDKDKDGFQDVLTQSIMKYKTGDERYILNEREKDKPFYEDENVRQSASMRYFKFGNHTIEFDDEKDNERIRILSKKHQINMIDEKDKELFEIFSGSIDEFLYKFSFYLEKDKSKFETILGNSSIIMNEELDNKFIEIKNEKLNFLMSMKKDEEKIC
jgi:hypothetical protein